MKVKGIFLIGVLFLGGLFSQKGYSQNKDEGDSLTIAAHFEQLYKESNRYQDYKVIKIDGYHQLENLITDSLNAYRSQIQLQQNSITNLKKQSAELKQQATGLQQQLKETQEARNELSLWGMSLSKSTYSIIVWTIIILLLIIVILLFSMYRNSHVVVKNTKKRIDEIQEDFEQHRKNALIKEQKLARELMDVKLKQKRQL